MRDEEGPAPTPAKIACMSVTVLEREVYSEAEAARLLQVAQSTLHYWLDGGTRSGRSYPPVIRAEATESRAVTWAEFVEAALLREYRRELMVPMPELRAFIQHLRDGLGIPYPLAHAQPFVGEGRQLVWDAQDAVGLAPEFCLVAEVRGQLVLTGPSETFYSRVRWVDQVAAAWRPASDPDSPVSIDPEFRFGRPAVRGISTETLWEHVDAGEDPEEIAADFDLTLADVQWAISYESARQAA
jgi:uncharacterized protein (DUF433 family)